MTAFRILRWGSDDLPPVTCLHDTRGHARRFEREQPVEFDPSFAEFSSLMTDVRYFDLRNPRLDSPG